MSNSESENITKNTLVIGGGGVHGIAYIGALQALHEKNILQNITTFCGSSVGAIIATMISIGYTPKELYEFTCALDISKLKYFTLQNFIKKYGLDDGTRIEYVIKMLMNEKGLSEKITFEQLYNITKKKLIITAVCMNDANVCYLSHETHPKMPLSIAIRMSISIPFFFTPVEYKNKKYIDGGCIDAYPMTIFKDNIEQVIGVSIANTINEISEVNNFEDYLIRVMQCIKKGNDFLNKKGFEANTISIPIKNYNFINFNLDKNNKNLFYKTGYDAAINFLLS